MPNRSCKSLAKFVFRFYETEPEVVAQSGDENGVFATCSTEGDIVAGTCRATFGIFCENSFLEEWSALVDDFRTFQGSGVPLGTSWRPLDLGADHDGSRRVGSEVFDHPGVVVAGDVRL
jgi:hypothetical protein